jgi:outer membrane receptor protein involved in Fe transport
MFSGVDRDGAAVIDPARIDDHLGARHYIDLAASFDVRERWNIRVGCNNLLDKDPPLTSQALPPDGNGNTYPQVYDSLGRYLFVGTTVDF